MQNNGVTPTFGGYITPVYEGKFFASGCRGFLYSIGVYCKNITPELTGAITVFISQYPSAPPEAVLTLNLKEAAPGITEDVAAVRYVKFKKWWTHDSMFIYMRCNAQSTQFAWDFEQPGDGFLSKDDGVTWEPCPEVYWIQLCMYGQTVAEVEGMSPS